MSTPDNLSEQATELYAAGKFIEAEPLFRQMLEEEPDNPQVLLLTGMCRRAQGDLPSAVHLVKRAAELDSSNALFQFNLGAILLDYQRPDQALIALESCVKINPNHGRARALIGYILFMQGKVDEAISELRTALKADPDQSIALTTLSLAFLQKRDLSKAHAYATRALEIQPDDAGAQSAMGQVLMAQGHLSFAEQCLRNALETHPQNPELNKTMALILQADQRHDEALAFFLQAARGGYQSQDFAVSMAKSLMQTGRSQQALQLLEETLKTRPDQAGLKTLVAEVRLETGDPTGCSALLDELDPSAPMVQLLQARTALAAGRHAQAKSMFEELLTIDHALVAAQARILLGKIAIAENDFEEAESVLMPFLQGPSADAPAIIMLAELAIKLENPERAEELLNQALSNSSVVGVHQSKCHQLLAHLHDRSANYAEAGEHLKRSGFRPAPIMRQLVVDVQSGLDEAWMASGPPAWGNVPMDDNVPEPILVLGWPGSGRAPLLSALAAHSKVWTLQDGLGRQRASSVRMPSTPEQLDQLTESELREGRQIYMSGESDILLSRRALETVWWEHANIPCLARFFPKATVIVPQAELADLELMWRLSGYGDISRMLELWAKEQALLDHLRQTLDLEFIDVNRGDLMESSEATLKTLCAALHLDFEDEMVERLRLVFEKQEPRPDGHWQHYGKVLSSTDASA